LKSILWFSRYPKDFDPNFFGPLRFEENIEVETDENCGPDGEWLVGVELPPEWFSDGENEALNNVLHVGKQKDRLT
jgi:hypothetical protein